jgi:ubiquinone/menaquinone biosynthesis C-methylase UbiE
MSDYEAKGHYKDNGVAQHYNAQYEAPLSFSNAMSKFYGWREEQAFQRLLNHVPAGGTVLDVACGTGRYTRRLLKNGYKAGGVDISDQMLEFVRRATEGNPDLLFLQTGDAEKLPFDDNEFDGLTCIRLYQRVPSAQRLQMLREVKRVSKNWAILLFAMSNPWLRLRQAIRRKLIWGADSAPNAVTIAEMSEELETAGLKLEERTWVMPVITTGMIVRVRCDS